MPPHTLTTLPPEILLEIMRLLPTLSDLQSVLLCSPHIASLFPLNIHTICGPISQRQFPTHAFKLLNFSRLGGLSISQATHLSEFTGGLFGVVDERLDCVEGFERENEGGKTGFFECTRLVTDSMVVENFVEMVIPPTSQAAGWDAGLNSKLACLSEFRDRLPMPPSGIDPESYDGDWSQWEAMVQAEYKEVLEMCKAEKRRQKERVAETIYGVILLAEEFITGVKHEGRMYCTERKTSAFLAGTRKRGSIGEVSGSGEGRRARPAPMARALYQATPASGANGMFIGSLSGMSGFGTSASAGIRSATLHQPMAVAPGYSTPTSISTIPSLTFPGSSTTTTTTTTTKPMPMEDEFWNSFLNNDNMDLSFDTSSTSPTINFNLSPQESNQNWISNTSPPISPCTPSNTLPGSTSPSSTSSSPTKTNSPTDTDPQIIFTSPFKTSTLPTPSPFTATPIPSPITTRLPSPTTTRSLFNTPSTIFNFHALANMSLETHVRLVALFYSCRPLTKSWTWFSRVEKALGGKRLMRNVLETRMGLLRGSSLPLPVVSSNPSTVGPGSILGLGSGTGCHSGMMISSQMVLGAPVGCHACINRRFARPTTSQNLPSNSGPQLSLTRSLDLQTTHPLQHFPSFPPPPPPPPPPPAPSFQSHPIFSFPPITASSSGYINTFPPPPPPPPSSYPTYTILPTAPLPRLPPISHLTHPPTPQCSLNFRHRPPQLRPPPTLDQVFSLCNKGLSITNELSGVKELSEDEFVAQLVGRLGFKLVRVEVRDRKGEVKEKEVLVYGNNRYYNPTVRRRWAAFT